MKLQLLQCENGTRVRIKTAGFVLAVWMLGAAFPAWAQVATRTHLSVNSEAHGAGKQTTFSASVTDVGGNPANDGVVSFDTAKGSIGAALVQDGHAALTVDHLPKGTQQVTAVYGGSEHFATSTANVQADAAQANASLPDFSIVANPSSVSLTPGQFGTVVLTITPENGFANMVTLSCSGNPAASTCVFSPTTVTPLNGAAATSSLQIQTLGPSGTSAENRSPRVHDGTHIAFAIILPGVLALIGIGALRKRSGVATLRVFGLLALLVASGLGLSACAARYDYLHKPPSPNPGVAAGNYTITIAAYSSNGTGVTSHTLTVALTVK
jgi:hypothetical protein